MLRTEWSWEWRLVTGAVAGDGDFISLTPLSNFRPHFALVIRSKVADVIERAVASAASAATTAAAAAAIALRHSISSSATHGAHISATSATTITVTDRMGFAKLLHLLLLLLLCKMLHT